MPAAQSSSDRPRTELPWILIISLIVTGFILRLYIATLGGNFDLGCWSMAGDLARQGRNVYAVDQFYNYGPLWLGIVTGIRALQHAGQWYGQNTFHLMVVAVLGLADTAVCLLLIRRYGQWAGLFFFLNPVMLLLTGFHSQVDTLAISFALVSWMILEPRGHRQASVGQVILSAIFMGLSLISKHIFILFPMWVVMCPAVGPLGRRLLFAVLSPIFFFSSFIPFSMSPAGRFGVWTHVFQYHGILSNTLFTALLNIAVPYRLLSAECLARFHHDPSALLLEMLFAITLLITGWWTARRKPAELLLAHYLLASIVFAISMADQYLAIPMVSCAMFYRRWPAWIYCLAATLVLLISPFNISSSAELPALDRFATRNRPLAVQSVDSGNDTALWMKATLPPVSYCTAQCWLIPLLFWDELSLVLVGIRIRKHR